MPPAPLKEPRPADVWGLPFGTAFGVCAAFADLSFMEAALPSVAWRRRIKHHLKSANGLNTLQVDDCRSVAAAVLG